MASPKKKPLKKAPVKKQQAGKKASPKKAVKKTAAKKAPVKKSATVKKPGSPFVGHHTHLKAGNKAPLFSGMDQHGQTISLTALKGKKVILYFYPKDDTPGCTAEACSLRDEHRFLGQKNYVVIGVSGDSVKSHKKFAEKYSLPFSLIADEQKEIIHSYDVWGKKMFMGRIFDGIVRTTFIIDENGIIQNVINDVNTKEHASQIMGL